MLRDRATLIRKSQFNPLVHRHFFVISQFKDTSTSSSIFEVHHRRGCGRGRGQAMFTHSRRDEPKRTYGASVWPSSEVDLKCHRPSISRDGRGPPCRSELIATPSTEARRADRGEPVTNQTDPFGWAGLRFKEQEVPVMHLASTNHHPSPNPWPVPSTSADASRRTRSTHRSRCLPTVRIGSRPRTTSSRAALR